MRPGASSASRNREVTRSEPLPPRGEGVGDGGAGREALDNLAAFNQPTVIFVERRSRPEGAIHTGQRADAMAKRMRKAPTLAEQRLWKELRKLDLRGSHFRRQVPMGLFIVDFVCHRARLAIEVDGGIHDLPSVAARDAIREEWLNHRGYTVVRVPNRDAVFEAARVAGQIAGLLSADTPTPNPLPARRRGP